MLKHWAQDLDLRVLHLAMVQSTKNGHSATGSASRLPPSHKTSTTETRPSLATHKNYIKMNAFIQTSLPTTRTTFQTHICGTRQTWKAQQSEDLTRPGFNRGDEYAPSKSFFEEPNTPTTPNDRALQQVHETIARLGSDEPKPQPRPFTPIDVSRVNPLSALAGAVAAGGISYATWLALGGIVAFFVSHPLDDQIYAVQRLGAVARTTLVCLFALASGMSGVTSVGLAGLFMRTFYGRLGGVFHE